MTTEPVAPSDVHLDWVPPDCTLPTTERPLRVAEFDRLFATALRGVERIAPTRLALRLDSTARRPAEELADRETGCCSFFTFAFTAGGADEVLLEVVVPATQVDVLDALAERATAGAGLRG